MVLLSSIILSARIFGALKQLVGYAAGLNALEYMLSSALLVLLVYRQGLKSSRAWIRFMMDGFKGLQPELIGIYSHMNNWSNVPN